MYTDFAGAPFALAVGRVCGDGTAGLQCFESEAAGAVVFCRYTLEDFDGFGIFSLADKKLWCFFQSDDEDAGHGHNEHESA